MTDQTVIHAWGNSQGIRLNKKIMEEADFSLSDTLQVEVSKDMIILRKLPKHRSFQERLDEYEGKISVQEFDWGEPEGRELL